ncbi:hypothetical protein C8035_v000623 [Colletotrichum spinosum]|uniref:Uncharacterized protein n=1 Tax=Colletotrichum spinosum TaxID=1347390 RepID=A0A4R8Q9K9_9PEZI|nr:hypothetical protein C8035_v000623 [Colletotrichum spinosum]
MHALRCVALRCTSAAGGCFDVDVGVDVLVLSCKLANRLKQIAPESERYESHKRHLALR